MINALRLRYQRLFSVGSPAGDLWLGWVLAITSAIAFSIVTPLAKAAINLDFDPPTLLILRFGIGTALTVGAMALTTPDKLRTDRRGWLVAGLVGLINGLGSLGFFWSLTRIEASLATMIFSLNPLAVLGILALAGEKLTRRHGVRLALALSGVYLLIGPGGQTDWLGVLLAFANVCSFALEVVLIQWFLAGYDTRTITVYVLGGMTVVMAGSWLIQGAEWQVPGWQGWLIVGIMALIGTFFGWWAMFSGLQRIGGGQVALLMPLETLLSVLWSVLFLQERLTLWQTLGSILILLSALLAIQRLKRANYQRRWRDWLRL
jgi:drug/metabolite transporter (DMT)-like permease